MRRNGITPEVCRILEFIIPSQNLKFLDISNNWIGMPGFINLGKLFNKLELIKVLQFGIFHIYIYISIDGNKLFSDEYEAVTAFTDVMKCLGCKLEKLSLDQNQMENEDLNIFCSALSHFPYLKSLSLKWNALSVEGLSSLTDAFPYLINLENLEIMKVKLGDEGAKELFSHLPALKNLKFLDLRSTDITNLSLLPLVEYLGKREIGIPMHVVLKLNKLKMHPLVKEFEEKLRLVRLSHGRNIKVSFPVAFRKSEKKSSKLGSLKKLNN